MLALLGCPNKQNILAKAQGASFYKSHQTRSKFSIYFLPRKFEICSKGDTMLELY